MAWRSRLSKAAKNINKRERSESAAPEYKKILEHIPESPIVEECLNENGNTENIQIHREALEKASGIFQQVLEDSPMTRELLKQSESQLENISTALKRIVKLSKQYQAAANMFKETATQFGQELLNFDYSDIPSVIGDQLKESAKILGGSILSVMDYQNRLINQFSNGFTQPMENYIKTEIKDAKETCKQQARLRIKYDTALSKYSHIKKTEVEKIPEAEHELFYIRKEFQQASLDYSSKLHKTETISKIQLLESSCSILNAEKEFLSNVSKIHDEVEPVLQDITKNAQIVRKYIELQDSVLYKTKEELRNGPKNPISKRHSGEGSNLTETAGYLFIKFGNKWKRRYFEVKDSKFILYEKDNKNTEGKELANLLLTTVKLARDCERRFCFELITPTSDTMLLQAENDNILNHWISVLQNATANALNNSSANPLKRSENNNDSEFLEAIRISPDNLLCADCGTPDPEWISINLGVIICITCSGIHRQLGTHISKIRSTTLDSWDKELKKLILALGNKLCNSFLEANVTDATKPDPASSRTDREEWITKKYVNKAFLGPLDTAGKSKELALYEAVEQHDVETMYKLIIHGANLNWQNPENTNFSFVHRSIILGNIVTTDLLIQNGADCSLLDANNWSPLHHASYLDKVDCLILLIRRAAKLDTVNNENLTALDIAIKYLRAHCVTLLRLAMHAEMENPGNALEDESFAMALRGFSEEVELMMLPQQEGKKEEPAASAPMPKVRPAAPPRSSNSPEKVRNAQPSPNAPQSVSKIQIPSVFGGTSAAVPPPTPPKELQHTSAPNMLKAESNSPSNNFMQQFQPKQKEKEAELPLLLSPRSKRTKPKKTKLTSTGSLSSAKVKKN